MQTLIENFKVKSCGIYTPAPGYEGKTPGQYFIHGLLSENEHLAEKIGWKPVRAPHYTEGEKFISFRSKYPPRVTCQTYEHYETLIKYRTIADVRNVYADRIFQGATVDIELNISDDFVNLHGLFIKSIFNLIDPADVI